MVTTKKLFKYWSQI